MNESLECVRLASSEAEYRKQGLLQRCLFDTDKTYYVN